MPLNIPNLDDRTYTDLVAEAISMLPRYAPEWTNHNPSDPGITLIELLAYFTEILIYRLNLVTRENKIKFLKLLSELDPTEEARLAAAPVNEVDEALKQVVLALRKPRRAVNHEDYERLALGLAPERPGIPRVARAFCLERRDLEALDEVSREMDLPGHVSMVIVPGKDSQENLSSLLSTVKGELDRARLLTTRLHVIGPRYVRVALDVSVKTIPGADESEIRNKANRALRRFFDPLPGGGPGGEGWPFGRALHLSEIYEQLESVEEIDFVSEVRVMNLTADGRRLDEELTAIGIQIGFRSTVGEDSRLGCEKSADTDRLVRDTSGKLLAIALKPYELLKVEVRKFEH